ncbi:phenylacetate--CoA ligase family protein [Glaciibacter psychrotolerans]|uniref:Phenylacetate-CoA ligase n=1 Tax=Glaciibacter psychrotolerans TaxID=670054 RepID=A0A7Z0J7A8_9MICO|nr:phenylacetate--CoA ligase family protein [Leifsonia psychrotolerans]NYJ21412.1 phenylacetate-CoA ligase [Leifsonia psychrotolerans]
MGAPLARASLAVKAALLRPRLRADDVRLRAAELRSPTETVAQQQERALALARFAFDHTDFYRTRYEAAGITRADLADPAVFSSLPIVEKVDLREHGEAFAVTGTPDKQRLPSSTGGSTGEPLTLFHDRSAPVAAMWWRVYRWWGVDASANKGFIQRERRTPGARLKERVEWWPTVSLFLDARELTEVSMSAFAADWNTHRPKLLNGYVGGVYEFASFIARSGTPFSPPTAIGVTAAPTTASQRRVIEDALGAPVYDQYRSAEVPWIAAECREREGLHVLADLRLVEIVDEQGDPSALGEIGDVVVTDLCNTVFPLIRYRLGDRSSLSAADCRCGLPFARLTPVQGRISDVLRLPGGALISGGLTGLFNARPDAVRQFQIHQHADQSITLRCVRGSASDSAALIGRAADELASIVGHTVPVRIELVDTIRHDRGKVRVVLSDL